MFDFKLKALYFKTNGQRADSFLENVPYDCCNSLPDFRRNIVNISHFIVREVRNWMQLQTQF